MVREAWNSVRAVPKQVVQGANLRKQCFEGVVLQILEVYLRDNFVLYQC